MMMVQWMKFRLNRKGQTVVEYALIVALIAIALIATVTAFRAELLRIWQNMVDALAGGV
ncbi:MAG: Flp family type IVb pilin [Candidatus Omnitrophica bacterium]|nr:Flp family type IVb pilin [Candidatus Omnitrophota bacterium]